MTKKWMPGLYEAPPVEVQQLNRMTMPLDTQGTEAGGFGSPGNIYPLFNHCLWLYLTLVTAVYTYNISTYGYSLCTHLYVCDLSNHKFITSVNCNWVCLRGRVWKHTDLRWLSKQTLQVLISWNWTVMRPFGVMRVTVPSPYSSWITWPPNRSRPSIPPMTASTAITLPTWKPSESGKYSSSKHWNKKMGIFSHHSFVKTFLLTFHCQQ